MSIWTWPNFYIAFCCSLSGNHSEVLELDSSPSFVWEFQHIAQWFLTKGQIRMICGTGIQSPNSTVQPRFKTKAAK